MVGVTVYSGVGGRCDCLHQGKVVGVTVYSGVGGQCDRLHQGKVVGVTVYTRGRSSV